MVQVVPHSGVNGMITCPKSSSSNWHRLFTETTKFSKSVQYSSRENPVFDDARPSRPNEQRSWNLIQIGSTAAFLEKIQF